MLKILETSSKRSMPGPCPVVDYSVVVLFSRLHFYVDSDLCQTRKSQCCLHRWLNRMLRSESSSLCGGRHCVDCSDCCRPTCSSHASVVLAQPPAEGLHGRSDAHLRRSLSVVVLGQPLQTVGLRCDGCSNGIASDTDGVWSVDSSLCAGSIKVSYAKISGGSRI